METTSSNLHNATTLLEVSSSHSSATQGRTKRLAVITTHPIQYYAPLFQLLAKEVDLKVFYTWGYGAVKKEDPGFGKTIEWDIPLLSGYEYAFETNISKHPGSHHYKGIINPDLVAQISTYDPDAIIVFGWAYQSHLKVIRYFKGKVPVWFRGDSTLLDNRRGWKGVIKSKIRRLMLKWVYSFVDLALYVGTANKAYYEWIGLKSGQLVFAPHAVDNQRFSENRSDEVTSLQAELEIPRDAVILLFAGKFEPKKNPLLLLNAFERSAADNQYLVLIGNGVLEKQIKELISGMSKKAQVRLLGFQNQRQMPVAYQMATVFCLPSSGPGETWGLAVNEAMAAGCAIWVSDKVGCAGNLVIERFNGKVLPANNLDQWSAAIAQSANKNSLIEQGVNSKVLISNYSFENICNKILEKLNAI